MENQHFALPPDWRHYKIGELERRGDVALFRGKVISQKDINRTPGDYPIYSSSVHSNGLFGYYGEYVFDEELITWSVDGGGHFFHRPKHRFSVTNVCGYLRVRTRQIDYRFLAFQLQQLHSRLVFDYTLKAHPSVIRGAYTVPLPPIGEQRAIAEALSDVDELLGALEALIAKKRAIKQAAMQQLLTGKTRLPGFSGEWETKRLGDVVERFLGGGTPSRANPVYWGNEIPWMTVKDFATFNPRTTQESITQLGLTRSASNLIPAETLITSTRMALGKAVIYEVDVAINQDLKALILKSGLDVLFVYYWFEFYGGLIDELASGSTVKGISVGELSRLPLRRPDTPEQAAIATVLSDMDAEIAALEAQRDKVHAIKQGMMQQLLTGRVRLVKPAAAA